MTKHIQIQELEKKQIKKDVPEFAVGDTVAVKVRIVDVGGKERLQTFTGTCIARTGTGISETFSLHRVAYGEGMERVFYINSPLVAEISVVRRGKVRRSKLYYLRGTTGKKSKVKGRFGSVEKNSSKIFNNAESNEAEVNAIEHEAELEHAQQDAEK